jgi:hypothetical protein
MQKIDTIPTRAQGKTMRQQLFSLDLALGAIITWVLTFGVLVSVAKLVLSCPIDSVQIGLNEKHYKHHVVPQGHDTMLPWHVYEKGKNIVDKSIEDFVQEDFPRQMRN